MRKPRECVLFKTTRHNARASWHISLNDQTWLPEPMLPYVLYTPIRTRLSTHAYPHMSIHTPIHICLDMVLPIEAVEREFALLWRRSRLLEVIENASELRPKAAAAAAAATTATTPAAAAAPLGVPKGAGVVAVDEAGVAASDDLPHGLHAALG